MMGCLDDESHILQVHDDVTTGILTEVQRSDVEISGLFVGVGRRHGIFIGIEQEKFTFGTYLERISHILSLLHRTLQHIAGIAFKRLGVGAIDITDHTRHLALLGSPGEDLQRRQIRIQIHIGFLDPGEAVDGGAVEHAFIVQYTIQLTGCHCNIFQIAKQIRELQTDEFHILFFHKTDDIFLGIIVHRYPRFCAACLLLFHGADASVKNTYTNYSNACFVLSMRSSPHLRYYVGGPAHTIYKDHPIIPRRLKNECKYKDRRTSQKRTALYRNLRRAGGIVHHITVNAVVAGQGYGCLLWDTGFP